MARKQQLIVKIFPKTPFFSKILKIYYYGSILKILFQDIRSA
ncbi:hypothetical protein DBT_1607 [Dissulfuribacter thermophilus]|uniref:Uncharacterized protein n=1 Tax=Dissulfuribacter thermophilus TaxID=1156395 RepID=A0A1B9F5S8_9BACT|nr:hypothetical protein DBT_1607 [Dissulfuribacter thermophilus]